MIFGIGIDLIKVSRIKKILDKHGSIFLKKVFTDQEIKKNNQFISRENKFAKSFASKEAFVKAMGTGFRNNITFKDIELMNSNTGKPYLYLSKSVKKELKKKTPIGYEPIINISISDEIDYVISNVIISFKKNNRL